MCGDLCFDLPETCSIGITYQKKKKKIVVLLNSVIQDATGF